METQTRKGLKILFFLVKEKSNENRNGFLKRFVCFIGILFFISHGVVYIQTNRALLTNRTDSVPLPDVRHIAFLKVHKTGSSTVQNIFLRYGYKRKLSIVLPTKGNKLVPTVPLLDPLQGKSYDILAIHSRFNESVFRSIVPNDSVYIGIVRDPMEVMVSSAYYHRNVWQVPYLLKVPDENYIQNLIRFPEMYDQQEYSLTKNSMADIFGFPKGLHVSDKNEIRKYLDYLGTIFRLVLIAEHFDESLVLMKRYLKWKLKDILYIPLNEHSHPSPKDLNISIIDQGKFKDRNYLDYELYNFFSKRFFDQLSLEKDVLDEINYFTSIQRKVQLFCLLGNTQGGLLGNTQGYGHVTGQGLRIAGSKWSDSFLVKTSDCDIMKMSELDFINKIRREHLQALLEEIS